MQRTLRKERHVRRVALGERIEMGRVELNGHDRSVGQSHLRHVTTGDIREPAVGGGRDLLFLHDHGRNDRPTRVQHMVGRHAQRGDRRQQKREAEGAEMQAQAQPEGAANQQSENQRGDRRNQV